MAGSEFDTVFEKVLVENTAQAVLRRLTRLKNARDRYKYRWVWELMQNASDAAQPQGVRVKVTAEKGMMTFCHTGKPFTDKNIGHLIFHGSTKQGEEDTAGRFGTGFMTTHLISQRVRVQGQLTDGRWFNFDLCREGDTADELLASMYASREQFESSLCKSIASTPEYATQYAYPLNDAVLRDVSRALDDLRQHGPFVLAFNERLCEVDIQLPDSRHIIAKGNAVDIGQGFSMWPIGPPDSLKDNPDVYVVSSAPSASAQVGVLLRKDDNRLIIDINDGTPRLFVLFPLLGTETFSFPGVINSTKFEPTEDRDGVFLWMSQDGKAHRNETILKEAIELALKLAALPARMRWERPDLLARVQPIREREWLCRDAYRDVVRSQLIGPLRNCALVVNMQGAYITPSTATIPMSFEVWECASQLRELTNTLPRRDDVGYWAQNINEWATILEVDPTILDEILTLKSIAKYVAEYGSIEILQEHLVDGSEPHTWLNSLLELLHKEGLDRVLLELSLWPSQKGLLCNQTDLYWDDGIDEHLKDIAEELGLPGRAELLSPEIDAEELRRPLGHKSEDKLIVDCIRTLKEQTKDHEIVQDKYTKVNVCLLAWIIAHEAWDHLNEFPALTCDDSPIAESVCRLSETSTAEAELPLGPSYIWPEKARRFADLFPPCFVLSEDYSEQVTSEMWSALANKGFVRPSPLFETTDNLRCFLADTTVPSDDEENQIEPSEEVTITQLAFLKLQNKGLIDRVRKDMKRAVQFIDFLLTFVLDEDKRAFETQCIQCTDKKDRKYYRAGWLIPLATRGWVPFDKRSTKASAESLGNLLRGHSDILQRLGNPCGRKWLTAIHVGFADLSLHTLAKDEEARVSLMSSILDIAQAAGGNAERVRKLASEISRYPQLLDRIEEDTKVREKIKKNQLIGRNVETLLRDALESSGVVVNRTGVGSDYEVENDSIEDDDEKWLAIGESPSYLIEVKSARSEKVGMTVTQAKKAVAEPDRFFLCVVAIGDEEVTERAIRAKARFIPDIGHRLASALKKFETFEKTRQAVRGTPKDADIEIDITGSDTRFRIATALAKKTGLSFHKAVKRFRGEP